MAVPSSPGPDPLAPAPAPAKKGGIPVWAIALIVVGVLMVCGIGAMATTAIFGTRKYITKSKEAEGRSSVAQMARDVATCAMKEELGTGVLARGVGGAKPRGLPLTTAPVPKSLSEVSGKKYQSAPRDWTGPGWDCIGFSQVSPQYFQYEWERKSTTDGVARARADFDGDGTPDVTFEMSVQCSLLGGSGGLDCNVSPQIIELR